jgi:cell division septum initiation protein DivIVA
MPTGYVLSAPPEASYRGVTSTPIACGIVVAVAAGSLWLLPSASAQSTDPTTPELEQLWDEYPIAPPETQAPVQPGPVEEPARTPTPRAAGDGDGSASWPVLGAGVGAALALLVAVGLVLRRRRRPPAAVVVAETPNQLIARAYALASEGAECDKYLHGQRHEGISVMTGTHDHDLAAATDAPSRPTPSSYADIGERVAGVLAAADTAASQIREDARASAEEILSLARDEAEALRREAAAYDADTRAAVESYASDRRREVDEDVQGQLADAERQARATREAAEAMARQIEDEARRRGQALRDESQAVEERLQKAAQGLRRMTAGIEELLGAPAGGGGSLTDALRPSSRAADVPVSAAPGDDR